MSAAAGVITHIPKEDGKIIITGTGRAGTTFLMILFSFLKLDTGWDEVTFRRNIASKCNSGLEKDISAPHRIIKGPDLIRHIKKICAKTKIDLIIIPIRDYEAAAESRVHNGVGAGGLFGAEDKPTQIAFYHKIMAEYLLDMVQLNIPTIFLDFKKMVSDPKYVYEKLPTILGDVTYEDYLAAFEFATKHQKRS
jgi:hypothetical protein